MSEEIFLKPYDSSIEAEFRDALLIWFEANGRHDLPWKPQERYSQKINLYRIWISEIMLQQTQVATVIPYFENFMAQFPTPELLASAPIDDVLKAWEGLGYYSRARNLHHAAQMLVAEHNGTIPDDYNDLIALKGIGPTTAAAILSQGYNLPFAILDGNVRRVLARILGCTLPRNRLDRALQPYADRFASTESPADYTQAIMDFGATLCSRKALCEECFFQSRCVAYQLEQVDQLPRPNPKREKPIIHSYLLIFMTESGEILIEKRPNEGIWAGLYSFPERPFEDDLEFWLEDRAIDHLGVESLTSFSHHFSHYRLDGEPRIIHLKEQIDLNNIVEEGAEEVKYQWITLEQFDLLPKPKPIIDLLTVLQSH